METVLQAGDNSGAKRVKCFKVLGGSNRKSASVGDIIVVSIKEALPLFNPFTKEIHSFTALIASENLSLSSSNLA